MGENLVGGNISCIQEPVCYSSYDTQSVANESAPIIKTEKQVMALNGSELCLQLAANHALSLVLK